LRIVNASHYAQFGGTISTVSRAVAILGFDQVRSVALSLMLFEHLHDKAQAAELKDEMVAAYLGAILSNDLCGLAGVSNAEQAFICSMFHRLGRLLACCYLRDEAQAVSRLMAAREIDERQASRQVLGLSYEELGAGVGKAWNLPETILSSMRRIDGKVSSRPVADDEKLRVVADLSNSLAHVVRTAGEHERGARLAALVEKFGAGTGISQKRLTDAVNGSMGRLLHDAGVLGLSAATSPVIANAKKWSQPASPAAKADPIAAIVSSAALPTTDPAGAASQHPEPVTEVNRQALLTAGVQDITTTLVGTYELNDVLRMVLETMYRAMGFARVLLFVSEAGRTGLRCRFGFGVDAETLVNNRLAMPLTGARDVFYAAVTQGVDLCIEDIDSDKVKPYIPKWYREAIRSKGMVLLPIVVNKKPIGLIYADAEVSSALQFKPDELNLLKTLRNQAVLAARSKS
jgi:HD-like signal output (HDOD) protein